MPRRPASYSTKRTGPSRRTQEQRDAINRRAAAWERPLSAWQVEALRFMTKQPLARGRAGWSSELLIGRYWQSQTIRSLAFRGLCSLYGGNAGRERFARITPKGRMAIKRHASSRHPWAKAERA
jgi:hypothetical protein